MRRKKSAKVLVRLKTSHRRDCSKSSPRPNQKTSSAPVTQDCFSAQDHRLVEHLSLERNGRATARSRGSNHALSPHELIRARAEASIDRLDLVRMDAQLCAETEPASPLRFVFDCAYVFDFGARAVNRRRQPWQTKHSTYWSRKCSGDIGKLHDQVADLKVELPKILNQMQAVIAAQTAKADVLQEPTQRAIQIFIRQEMKGIKVAVKEAQASAISSLNGDISCAVRKNLDWAQYKCEQSFGIVAKKFDTAVTESAKVAESRAIETLKGLCQGLKNRIDEIHAERWRGQYLSMLCACTSCGLAVGVLAVYILK